LRAPARPALSTLSLHDALPIWLSGLEVSDFGCTLKAIRREVVEDARLGGEMHRLLPGYASGVGARITELPVAHRPRTYGRSKRRSEEHTSELQSLRHLVCRLLL